MKKNIKLIVCDIDGTLANSKKEISKEFFEFVKNNKDKYKFAIASGRQVYSLKKNFKEIEDILYFLSDNGAFIFHKDNLLYSNTMDKVNATAIINKFDNMDNLVPIVCGQKKAYIADKNINLKIFADMYYERLDGIINALDVLDEDYIAKIALYCMNKDAQSLVSNFNDLPLGYRAIASASDWIDVSSCSINKGEALKNLISILNITKDNVMVFGDFYNDLEMFNEATYSIAMKNSCQEIKDIAYFITDSNDNDGVMKVLNNIESFDD